MLLTSSCRTLDTPLKVDVMVLASFRSVVQYVFTHREVIVATLPSKLGNFPGRGFGKVPSIRVRWGRLGWVSTRCVGSASVLYSRRRALGVNGRPPLRGMEVVSEVTVLVSPQWLV